MDANVCLLCGLGQDLLNGQYDQQRGKYDRESLAHRCFLFVSPDWGGESDTRVTTV